VTQAWRHIEHDKSAVSNRCRLTLALRGGDTGFGFRLLGGARQEVQIENRSSEVVVYFEDGVPIDLLQPGVTYQSTVPPFTGTNTYSVQSFQTREVLAERTYTWDEIVREDGIEIVLQ
jgi:hypothetical protein